VSEDPFTPIMGGRDMDFFYIYSSYAGTIYDICIDDDGVSCSGGGGGDDGGGTGTTTVATSTTIDNPSQNIFNGFIMFFIGLYLAIWIHKKK